MSESKVAELCPDMYIYCAVPPGKEFPKVAGVPAEWYEHSSLGQLEFRKYVNDIECKVCGHDDIKHITPYSGWMVTPVLYIRQLGADEEKKFPEIEMKDLEVLQLWIKIVEEGGCVSDGYLNLFSS